MSRSPGWLVLACLVPLLQGDAVAGKPLPLPCLPERLARADCAVVGKVVRIEGKTIRALPPWGAGDPLEYQIAVVQITESFKAPRGLTHLRVGILPAPLGPGFGGRPLAVGAEACLFLSRHPRETFFVVPMYYDVVPRAGNARFERDLALVRRCARLLKKPLASLKADRAEDRFLTAALLLQDYRWRRGGPGPVVQEPIPAEESKLILTALAEADWKKADPALGYRLSPARLFAQLGVMEKDGWVPPRNARDFPGAARKWLREHAGSYRIRRYTTKEEKRAGS